MASHKPQQRAFLSYLETPLTKDKALLTLSDGMSTLGSCLELDKAGKALPGFSILATNYWDSQMKVADRINSGGVRHWLYNTATKALEALVNGKDPDLMHTSDLELKELYEKAEKRARKREERKNKSS